MCGTDGKKDSLQLGLGLLDMGIGGGAGPAPSFACRFVFFGGGGGAGFFFAAAAAPAGDGITPVCCPGYGRVPEGCTFCSANCLHEGSDDDWAGAVGVGFDPVARREKRCCNSFSWLGWPCVEGGVGAAVCVLLLLIPKPGTDTPACPSRLSAPWFRVAGLGADGCVASPYVGGGAGVFSSGYSFCLGGRTGGGLAAAALGGGGGVARAGRPGFALGGGGGPGLPPGVLLRLTGGGGRWSVRRPEVSLRYGPEGGFAASSCAANSSCVKRGLGAGTGAPKPPLPPDGDPVFARLGVGEDPFGP